MQLFSVEQQHSLRGFHTSSDCFQYANTEGKTLGGLVTSGSIRETEGRHHVTNISQALFHPILEILKRAKSLECDYIVTSSAYLSPHLHTHTLPLCTHTMHTHTYVHTHAHTHTHTHNTHTHAHTHTHTYTWTQMSQEAGW